MTLESGDAVPEECEAVGEVPLVLPSSDPLDFSSTEDPWAFRLPLAEAVAGAGGIRAFVEGGEVGDDDRPREICGDFGTPGTLLRMALKEHVPDGGGDCGDLDEILLSAGDFVGGGCSSPPESPLCFVAPATLTVPSVYFDPVWERWAGGTWEAVEIIDDDRESPIHLAGGEVDEAGNLVGMPATLPAVLVRLCEGEEVCVVETPSYGYEMRFRCPVPESPP